MSDAHNDNAPRIVTRANAEHYVWGEVCDGWHRVRQPGLSVIEERMPAGACETRHAHARARQLFLVLKGTLTMEVEGTTCRLGAGESLEIAPGVRHQAINGSQGDVEFLVVSAPAAHGDRIVEG